MKKKNNGIFVGIGYDIHRFKKNRKLILGGVKIPYRYGLSGHSDADVLLHAIADAILGAVGLNDIGIHFPNTSSKYRNISSKIILDKTYKMCKNRGYRVNNVDCTVIAQEPSISEYKYLMKKNISKIVETHNVNIKATTNEGLGLIGKKKGIASFAVVSVIKK